jgi:hypothetical protein
MKWETVLWRVLSAYGYFILILTSYYLSKYLTHNSISKSDLPANLGDKAVGYSYCVAVVLLISTCSSFFAQGLPLLQFCVSPCPTIESGIAIFIILFPASFFGIFNVYEEDKHMTQVQRRKRNLDWAFNKRRANRDNPE